MREHGAALYCTALGARVRSESSCCGQLCSALLCSSAWDAKRCTRTATHSRGVCVCECAVLQSAVRHSTHGAPLPAVAPLLLCSTCSAGVSHPPLSSAVQCTPMSAVTNAGAGASARQPRASRSARPAAVAAAAALSSPADSAPRGSDNGDRTFGCVACGAKSDEDLPSILL